MPTVAMPPDHVVIVVEENQDYSKIIGSPDAPFINILATQGALFTNYHGVARPSQPNYFAMFSGSTHGVRDNNAHSFTAPTLAGQLTAAGYSFGGYAETGSPRKHNPWESFADAKAFGRDFKQFPSDFSKLPTVSFVSPNQQNDMHDGTIRQGDQWLKDNLAAYAEWAKTHNSLLIVTFDEDGQGGDNRVPTVIVGDGVAPLATGQAVNHYSLLHTFESLYELPALDQAATAPMMGFGRATSPVKLPINPRMSGPTEAVKPNP
jgi:phosphatidylinositol-3-phosphatase